MKKTRKALSLLLTLCMVTSMCPPALAEEFSNEMDEQIEYIKDIQQEQQKQIEQIDETITDEEQEAISNKETINEEITDEEQNITPSEEVNYEEDTDEEENEESRENEEGISSHKSDTDIIYPVTGGNIYFDEATGTITDCDSYVTEAIIPSKINGISVTSIDKQAFDGCRRLISIKIPNSVTSIEDEAFYDCSSLILIEIPNSVTSIGNGTFWGCSSLTSTKIPNGVTSISNSAFRDCSSLTSIKIPENVTSIGGEAFLGCSSLTSIEIPNSVTSIGDGAFNGCNSLISIGIPNGVTSIGRFTFYRCSSLISIKIPENVTSIGEEAFCYCSSLTSIKIPDGVTSIDHLVFGGCSSLTSIKIPNSVTSIGYEAFASCSNLINIELPDSITSIDDEAFYRCGSLTSIRIPNGVKYIGYSVFDLCKNLKNIIIPDSVTKITHSAFESCDNLKDIYYTGTEEQWNEIDNESKTNFESLGVTIHYNYTGSGEDIGKGNQEVRFFNDYNEKDKKVFFDNSTLAYSITDNTNMSFASSLDALLNKYVLVSTENGNSNILSIKPVESKIGTVTGVDYSADSKITYLTIDGIKYPVAENMFLVPVSGDSVLLYHIYEGKIVDLDFLVQKTGTLEAWDDSTQTATINGTKYPTNYVSDTTGINQFLGKDINFYINNRTNYIPLMKIIGIADDVEKCNKVSMNESKIDMAENTKKEIRALLIFDKREKNLSWTWTSNNPDIVDFDGQSTLTKSTTETPPVTTSDIVNICGKKVGTATITCTLSDGTKATATVNVETKKALKAKEKLEKELEKWEQSYNEYIQSIEETTKEKAGITVNASSKDEIIDNFEKKLSDMGIQIIAESGISDEGKKYVYGALLEMFAEEIKASPKFSTLSMDKNKLPKNIVNEVIKMFRVYNYTKRDGKHSVEINLINFGGNFGSITYSDSKRIYTIAVVSSVDKMLDVADEFILDLLKLDKNLIDYAYKEVVDELSKELFGKTVDSLKQEAVANKIGKFLDKFKKLGLGDVVEIVNDSYDFYKKVKDVFKNDPDSVINGIKNIKFESKSVNQKVAKKAIDAMEKARKNICKYIEEYFKNGGTISSKKGVRSLIQCPVDVDVFDNIGNMIAYVHDDGNIWYAENAEDIVEINIIGDAKEIYSGEEDIHLKITATDEGVLNCIFEQLSDDEFVKRINYYDIELYEGKEVTAAITNESNEEESNVDVQVEVQESGREIPADEIVTQSNQVTISCIMEDSSAGEVIGGGTYTAGDMATVRATSKEGYHFLGWKNSDDMLVSTSHIYIFTAKENDTLKAIFTKDIFIDDSVDYTITFDSGDGSGTMDSITAHDGEIIKLPDCTFTAPTNKEFKAWFIDDAEYDEGDNFIVAADSVAYAIWKDKTATPPSPSIPSNKYIIAYNSNGGSGEMKFDTVDRLQ